jgi:hypothetical protein
MLLYLHGFRSSPGAAKALAMQAALEADGLAGEWACPQLSPVPDEALAEAAALIEAARSRGEAITLLGSSLGGHYASCLAERYRLPAVLINPALIARLDLGLFIGRHSHFHNGEFFDFTAEHAAQLLAQVPEHLSRELYWLLLAGDDEVLDPRQAEACYAGCRQNVLADGGHSFSHFDTFIPTIVAEHRQRLQKA